MNESRSSTGFPFVQQVEQQPETHQHIHEWMTRLEAVSLGIMVAVFLAALYVSFNWAQVNVVMIPVAWFTLMASGSLLGLVMGLHSVLTGVSLRLGLPGESRKVMTGRAATATGWFIIAMAVINAVFWGVFAYAVVTYDTALVGVCIRILSTILGVVVVFSVIGALVKQVFKSR